MVSFTDGLWIVDGTKIIIQTSSNNDRELKKNFNVLIKLDPVTEIGI
jgi:hypothetical protein